MQKLGSVLLGVGLLIAVGSVLFGWLAFPAIIKHKVSQVSSCSIDKFDKIRSIRLLVGKVPVIQFSKWASALLYFSLS